MDLYYSSLWTMQTQSTLLHPWSLEHERERLWIWIRGNQRRGETDRREKGQGGAETLHGDHFGPALLRKETEAQIHTQN